MTEFGQKNIEDIDTDERYREMVQDARCLGIFVMFTAKEFLWVLKEQRQSWYEVYFREIILQQHVIPFPRDPNNVLGTNEVMFLHHKSPCMKANATQHLSEDETVNSWDNSIWLGNSSDMKPAEKIGAIIKDKVEELMASEDRQKIGKCIFMKTIVLLFSIYLRLMEKEDRVYCWVIQKARDNIPKLIFNSHF
jgi:hypothetical protein